MIIGPGHFADFLRQCIGATLICIDEENPIRLCRLECSIALLRKVLEWVLDHLHTGLTRNLQRAIGAEGIKHNGGIGPA